MTLRPVRYALAVALALVGPLWPSLARADDDLEGLLDQSVVTTASSSAEKASTAPATSSVITGEDLRKYGARTLSEAMDMLALGTMSTGGTNASALGARGMVIAQGGGAQFLLLINGQRVNDTQHGGSVYGRTAGIPLEIIDHIEVILGPGSVLYGSNAMLGVVNVVTKDAKSFSGVRVGVEADVLTSVRPWLGVGESFALLGVPSEVTLELEYYRQSGPGLYYQPVYGGNDPVTDRPFRYTSAAQGTGVWGGAYTRSSNVVDAPSLVGRFVWGKLAMNVNAAMARAPLDSAPTDFDSRSALTTRRLLVDLTYDTRISQLVTIKTRAYLNAADDATSFIISRSPECPAVGITCRVQLHSEGIARGVEVAPTFDWLKDGRLVTLVGGSAAWRSARSQADDFDNATNVALVDSAGRFDRSDLALGAYLQQTVAPVSWFGASIAGRVDREHDLAPAFSPRVAVHVDPWAGGTLKTIYSEAFRAPSFYEKYFGAPPIAPANPELHSEHEQSLEASLEQRFAAQRILFGVFTTSWTNLVEYHRFSPQEASAFVTQGKGTDPPEYQYQNTTSIHDSGVNASFAGSLLSRRLEYGVNVTAALAREELLARDPAPLDVAPRLFGNARVAYSLGASLPTLALAASFQGKRAVEHAFDGAFPTPFFVPPQLVLHATVSGELPVVHGLSYRVTGHYSTTDRSPLLAGPVVGPSAQYTSPALTPIDRARLTVGLQYEF